ncbi:hypothetical protein HKX48_005015 [Thoreauomyces humboldtii]|nr:hypothetical protein HKX48_005015 [Thoreauomyces humboldtii]
MGKKRMAPTKAGAKLSLNGTPRDKDPRKAKDSQVQSDMPRAYRSMLASQKFSKYNLASTGAVATKKLSTKIAPRKENESISEYNRRVDDTVRASVNAAVQSTSKTRQKKKTWLKTRKVKAATTKSASSRVAGEDSADEEERLAKTEKIKFGTVAMQPPSITAVPKQRGGNAAAIAALHKFQAAKAAQARDSDDSDDADSDSDDADSDSDAAERSVASHEPKAVGRKRKLKTLPEVERIAITAARENAIQHYRMMKASSSTREREEGSDDPEEESD